MVLQLKWFATIVFISNHGYRLPSRLLFVDFTVNPFAGGDWQLYLNSSLELTEISIMREAPIPSGGEFVLGQAARLVSEFNESYAFLGDLAHLNIWNYILAVDDIRLIHQSCTFMYCGNVVQWAELRRGTRGAMKMRWPSGIIGTYG